MESQTFPCEIEEFTKHLVCEENLKHLFARLLEASIEIGRTLQTIPIRETGTKNEFDEKQLSADVEAENILRKYAESSSDVAAWCSEEDTSLHVCNEKGQFILGWDPLDGSSIVDCNWTVGTIISIFEIRKNGVEWKHSKTLIGCTGRQQVGSIIVLYGPRMTAVLGINKTENEEGCIRELMLNIATKQCICVSTPRIDNKKASIFSPANLRASQDLPSYSRLLDYWIGNRYTLRYTGGLVPDVYQIFVKKNGVFCNPASEKAIAKLRLIFEIIPISLLIELANGKTSNGFKSALDIPIEKMDQRTPFCCGTPEEVDRFEEYMKPS